MTGVPLTPIEAIENLSSIQSPTKKNIFSVIKIFVITCNTSILKNNFSKICFTYSPIAPPFVVGTGEVELPVTGLEISKLYKVHTKKILIPN